MKSIIFITLFVIPFKILGQEPTIKETQDWIKHKIESHPITSTGYSRQYAAFVDFIGDTLIISQIDLIGGGELKKAYLYVPFIKTVTIKVADEKGNQDFIEMYGHDEWGIIKIDLWLEKVAEYCKENNCKESWTIGSVMLVDMSFFKDDLPKRMEDAFRHLVKLHGGEMLKEVF